MTRVLHYFEPSTHGVPNFVSFLAQHQSSSGHHAAILGPNPRQLNGIAWTNDEIQRSSPLSILQSGRRAARLAEQMGADIIHAHSFFAGLAIRLANPSQPVVYTPHAWAFAMSGPARYPAIAVERALLSRTERVLCVSRGAASAGIDVLGTSTPIVSIGSAIDLDRFSVNCSREVDSTFAANAPFAVCVGRISYQKGQLALADIWSKTMSDHPLQLVFVGDGHPDIEPENYPVSNGNVHFVGSSSNVSGWLRAAEFAVQPSRWEAMSLATVEALACGRPVIATDVAGMQEAIADGPLAPAGLVVPSIADVAPAARAVFDNPARMRGFSAMARRRSEVLYSADRLVASTQREYELAIGHVDLTVSADNVVELRGTRTLAASPPLEQPTEADGTPEVAA